jgi:hypothetical protein
VLRLAQVEQHSAPALERICQQESALRHLQFCVVRRPTWAGYGNGSHYLAVVRRFWVGIEHREEIAALFRIVTRPDKQVRIALGVPASGPEQQEKEAAEITHRQDCCRVVSPVSTGAEEGLFDAHYVSGVWPVGQRQFSAAWEGLHSVRFPTMMLVARLPPPSVRDGASPKRGRKS